jgi:hypothetical protein
MQCSDNKKTIKTLLVALLWMFLFQTGFARTLTFFDRFARTLQGPQNSTLKMVFLSDFH